MSANDITANGQAPENNRRAVRQAIRENAFVSPAYLVMNALSAVVASYGLLQDSTAVVIGAMIIAMLLGPITGIALALADGDQALLVKALIAEVAGALLVLVIGFSIGKLHPDIPLGKEILGRTSPSILDLVIALAAGAAGAYATLSPRVSASLVGVAIATALVPPLCACAICLSRGMYREGGGAFLLFLANLVAIQCVTSLTLWLNGYRSQTRLHGWALIKQFGPSTLLLGTLAIFLAYSFQKTLAREAMRTQAQRLLRKEIEKSGAAHLADLRIQPVGRKMIVVAVVRAPWVIVPESCARLLGQLKRATGRQNIDLRIRTILTRECDSQGFLWDEMTEAAVLP